MASGSSNNSNDPNNSNTPGDANSSSGSNNSSGMSSTANLPLINSSEYNTVVSVDPNNSKFQTDYYNRTRDIDGTIRATLDGTFVNTHKHYFEGSGVEPYTYPKYQFEPPAKSLLKRKKLK